MWLGVSLIYQRPGFLEQQVFPLLAAGLERFAVTEEFRSLELPTVVEPEVPPEERVALWLNCGREFPVLSR